MNPRQVYIRTYHTTLDLDPETLHTRIELCMGMVGGQDTGDMQQKRIFWLSSQEMPPHQHPSPEQ